MKKNEALILLPVFIDSCSNDSNQYGTGTEGECLEGVTQKLVLAKHGFSFASLDEFRDEAKWTEYITSGDLVPLYEVFEVASANTEAVKYESGSFSYVTEKEVKKMTAESYLSICSHRAYKSYEQSNFTQVFEVTKKNEALGVYKSDGISIKGQDITDLDVAIRERPTDDKPAFSMVTVTFRDFEEFEDNGIIVKQDWSIATLNGVFEIRLQIVSADATTIVVKATVGCGSTMYEDIEQADWNLLDSGGVVQTVDGSSYAAGAYTITGTGLTSGSLGLLDVIAHGEFLVQGAQVPVTIA